MRYYSSVAAETTLDGGMTNSTTTMVVASVSGFPVSYPYTLVIDKDTTDEEIVTVSAASGTTITLSERGADGSLATTHSAGAVVTHMATARDFREPQEHIDDDQDVHGIGSGAAVVGTTSTQTLTNKTISGASNTVSNIAQSSVTSLVSDLAARPTLTGTQTLTNKTMSGAANTFSNIPQSAVTDLETDLATVDGKANALDIRTPYIIRGGTGLVVIGNGDSTSVSSALAHGLGGTPAWIILTPLATGGQFVLSTRDWTSTEFRVAVRYTNDSATSTGSTEVSWSWLAGRAA